MPIKLALLTSILARATNSNKQLDGIGVYSNELVKEFTNNPDVELKKFAYQGDVNSSLAQTSGYKTTSLGFKTSSALSYAAGISTPGLNALLSEQDIIHCPDHCIPRTEKIPLVASIMDVIPLSHPQFVKSHLQKFKAQAFQYLAKRANHLITISEYSAQEMSRLLKIDRERITVTPLGVHPDFFERSEEQYAQQVIKKYGLKQPYFICIGTLQPRKNIPRLIEAYKLLPSETRQSIQLLIVGRQREDMHELVAQIKQEQKEGGVLWINYVTNAELKALLQNSVGMVFASLYEGFGLPILEAFASSVPVITSNATSMPEVAQDAALLVDPYSVGSISNAMHELINSPSQTKLRVQKGLLRAKQFYWGATVDKTIDVYKQVLSKA